MRRAALVLILTLPGCLLGRSLYLAPDDSAEMAVTADASQADGAAEQAEMGGGSNAPNGAPGANSPDATMGVDSGVDRPDTGARDAGAPLCVAGGALEREPFDTSAAAEAMKLGITCGALGSPTDNDWFTFDSGDDQRGLVVLSFKADADARVRIQNGILVFEAASGEGFSIPSDGRWLARVYSPGGQAQKYTLTRPAR